jgi:formylglycine-generating enzyme required for sulfatase activity
VCIEGGAFWLGDPGLLTGDAPPNGERLVVVSPFLLDRSELTVAAFRARSSSVSPRYQPVVRGQDVTSITAWCTWTLAPSGLEQLPVNCLSRDAALMYCKALGRSLPSEAQYEFAASGRGEENIYPWGGDTPGCADAVWGLGGGGGRSSIEFELSDSSCRPADELGGPEPPGSGLRDRLSAGGAANGGEVLDLAGNVSEWVLDGYSPLDAGVWATPGILVDPVESPLGADDTTRGGSWRDGTYQLRAGTRAEIPHNNGAHYVGFRCAAAGR